MTAGVGDEVVPVAEYHALQNQVYELQRLLGMKTQEYELLRETKALTQSRKPTSHSRSTDRPEDDDIINGPVRVRETMHVTRAQAERQKAANIIHGITTSWEPTPPKKRPRV
jgi:hypothetical protein